MRDDIQSLNFPSIPLGARETPRDLKRLLYMSGAELRLDAAALAIDQGRLGNVLSERVELVSRIHACIAGKLAGGGSTTTAKNQIDEITSFFAWAERAGTELRLENVQVAYLAYAEHLVQRSRVIRDLSENSAYQTALRVSQLLDDVLERPQPIIHLTRLTRPKVRKTAQGAAAEKQVLSQTFAFGHLLQDICDGLPLTVIWGNRDVHIALRSGGFFSPWVGGSKRRTERPYAAWERRNVERGNEAYAARRTLEHRGRKALVNMRILAEMLMFIGQTGMNLGQAYSLKIIQFSYSSDVDGYKIRDYKARRAGEVLFEIFSEYRAHFERYLEWRRSLFPNHSDLFPILRNGSHESRAPRFDLIIEVCKKAGVPWTPPSALRGTRVNWLLRRSGDPDLTAELAQHHKQTLLQVYERPSQQRTVGEVGRFWSRNDPLLISSEPSRAVAPGECDGRPVAVATTPKAAPKPDCARPSGCLWCEHHRDIDSLEYVWSLACFRHLKSLELGRHVYPVGTAKTEHPALHVIEKLTEKLRWFRESNEARRGWVTEALARVEEGEYQAQWKLLIQDMEGGST